MTDEREAKFEKLALCAKELISDMCGMKIEDLDNNTSFNELARTMASMMLTIRAIEKDDASESVTPNDYGVTIVLHYIEKDASCTVVRLRRGKT